MVTKAKLSSKVTGYTLTYKELIDIIVEDVGIIEVDNYIHNIRIIGDAKELDDYYSTISQLG
jgi:hypothetical protein